MIDEKVKRCGDRLSRHDLSPDHKKLLWRVMERHEASPGFSYSRFFQVGFRQWELLGVDRVVKDFADKHGIDSRMRALHLFYDALGSHCLKLEFIAYANSLGMSRSTAYKRFGKLRGQNFREYERVGIFAIIQEFEAEAQAKHMNLK